MHTTRSHPVVVLLLVAVLATSAAGCLSAREARRADIIGTALIVAGAAAAVALPVGASQVPCGGEPYLCEINATIGDALGGIIGGPTLVAGVPTRMAGRAYLRQNAPEFAPGVPELAVVPLTYEIERASRQEAAIRDLVRREQYAVCADNIEVCAAVFACLAREDAYSCAIIDDLASLGEVDAGAWNDIRHDVEVQRGRAYDLGRLASQRVAPPPANDLPFEAPAMARLAE